MELYKFRNYNLRIKYTWYKVVILRFMRKIMYFTFVSNYVFYLLIACNYYLLSIYKYRDTVYLYNQL